MFIFHLYSKVDCELLVSLNLSIGFMRQFIGLSNIWCANSKSSRLEFGFVQLYFSALNLRTQQLFSFLNSFEKYFCSKTCFFFTITGLFLRKIISFVVGFPLGKNLSKHPIIICKEKELLKAVGSGKKSSFLAVWAQTLRAAKPTQVTPRCSTVLYKWTN